MTDPSDSTSGGRLVDNLLHFARVLRKAGLLVGPGQVLKAIEAVQAVGIGSRQDLYWTLHASFVTRRPQREIFDQAFHIFWRNPQLLEKAISMLLPEFRTAPDEEAAQLSRRLTEALHENTADRPGPARPREEEEIDIDAALTWSDRDVLRAIDFEQMSSEEVERAKRALQRLRLPVRDLPIRRFSPHPHGRGVDMRRTLRLSMRGGGRAIPLLRRRQKRRSPPLVVLCDISGSMARYTRMLLHFLHAVTNDRDRVQVFLFGTRLSCVTRQLRRRDVDEALAQVSIAVADWSGGTRIGACLRIFNRDWSRRVLGQGAVVLFISDGLDRDGGEGLETEIERLHKSCRRLVWLNPLLRYGGYAPKTQGAKRLIPHVDEFRSIHNLESLEQLAAALSNPAPRRLEAARHWSGEASP